MFVSIPSFMLHFPSDFPTVASNSIPCPPRGLPTKVGRNELKPKPAGAISVPGPYNALRALMKSQNEARGIYDGIIFVNLFTIWFYFRWKVWVMSLSPFVEPYLVLHVPVPWMSHHQTSNILMHQLHFRLKSASSAMETSQTAMLKPCSTSARPTSRNSQFKCPSLLPCYLATSPTSQSMSTSIPS